MDPRKQEERRGGLSLPIKISGLLLGAIIVLGSIVIWIESRDGQEQPVVNQPPSEDQEIEEAPSDSADNNNVRYVQFQMQSLDQGWIRLNDGYLLTNDSGMTWQPSVDNAAVTNPGSSTPTTPTGRGPDLMQINYQSEPYFVRQSQFLTSDIGWVLVEPLGQQNDQLEIPLLLTLDGGQSWQHHITSEHRSALELEHQRQLVMEEERELFSSTEDANQAMESKWTLMPNTAYPGDVVLVRSEASGEVEWGDKMYELKPFKTGYYTYLPIHMNTSSGEYTIGDQILTVQSKEFETQYLQVTEKMEGMRRDYERIAQDQVKINKARSQSADEFLFSESFVQPVEGRLTTPYGYTRYVNGEFSGSHTAIDLAAKEGTPVMATNDGVVAIADEFYLIGNGIYLDHGMGLFSQYAHLFELKVKTGDTVKRGDVIGLVGTTGFSTGPHLHFAFWSHNIPVNPNLFFDSSPFHWSEPQE